MNEKKDKEKKEKEKNRRESIELDKSTKKETESVKKEIDE